MATGHLESELIAKEKATWDAEVNKGSPKSLIKWLAHWLKHSPWVQRHQGITSVAEAIGVIDRFIDDRPSYPLEWDDFISWQSSVEGVERLRNEIASLEPMFLSEDRENRLQGHKTLVEIRNYYAGFNGIPQRPDKGPVR